MRHEGKKSSDRNPVFGGCRLLIGILLLTSWAWPQERGESSAKVSPEFAKAANVALVAIRNSTHSSKGLDDLGPDQTVQTALNSADAAAVSATETSIVQQLKFLAIMRPLELRLYDLSPGQTALAELEQTNNCIDAWRKALRDSSGSPPKECQPPEKKK